MQRNGILSVGLLLLSCLTVRAQDQPVLDLKAENELLRRERDAFESRVRIMQEQLDEARRAASAARLEIDGLETQCRKLQDELGAPFTGLLDSDGEKKPSYNAYKQG